MLLKALFEMIRSRQLFPLLKLARLTTPYYRLSYIASLAENGFFDLLGDDVTMSLDEIARTYGIESEHTEALRAWLQVGVKLGELDLTPNGYTLKGLSAQLAKPEHDALSAITQEVVLLHHKLILDTPARLKSGQQWTLNDQDGELIARSSRIVEPFQRQVIDETFPEKKPVRLLEVGCGTGVYIRHAAMKNHQLHALGVELQPEVAAMARSNMAAWRLQDRVTIETGDIRNMPADPSFDIVTLYNNIYYFPVAERVALLKHLKSFLKPGGFLVLTTGCQGGQALTELLNLWGASTEGADRLPARDEMIEQMQAAGFTEIQSKNLLPGDSFYMFVGHRPA